jgi:uncharacterized protein YegL
MMAPILFINVALGIVFAEGLLRGSRTDIGHTNAMNAEAGAKSSLEKFLADVSPTIDALLDMKRTDANHQEGWAGIISHGAATIDPSQAASLLLSNTGGAPEELRDVLHQLVKRNDGKSKTRRAKASLAQHVQPATTSEYINEAAEDQEPLEVSEDAVKKSVKKLNSMVEEARVRLDNKCMQCYGELNKTHKAMVALQADIDRLSEEFTELQALLIHVKSAKERAEEELEDIKASNLTMSTDYFNDLEVDTKEMHRIKEELAVTKFMLDISRCPADELPSSELLQKNMAGGVKIQSCGTNGSKEFTFVDSRLETSKKRLSPRARELLAFSLLRAQSSYGAGDEKLDDGDDDGDAAVDESGWEYVEQEQFIGMIQTRGKEQKHQQPCPIGHLCSGAGLNCDQIIADCGQIHDTIASIWGEIKDEYETLKNQMAEKKAEYEKQKDYYNTEANILSLQVSNLDEKYLAGEERKIGITQKLGVLEPEFTSEQKLYNKKCDGGSESCKVQLEQIAGTEICGPLAVRNELLANVLKMKKTDIGDCETTGWVSGDCSVACDDTLVGGLKPMERQIIVSNSSFYGLPCPELSLQQKCGQFKCPIDCEVDDWSDWSECTRECGGGTETRSRNIKTKPAFGGKGCDPLTDVQSCATNTPCNKHCVLSKVWTPWTPCSKACGGGEQASFKDVEEPAFGLKGKCEDYHSTERYKTQLCNVEKCVGDEMCIAEMDVVMVIDGSGSLTEKGFGILKNLSMMIVGKLNATAYGNPAVRIGVVQFGNGHLKNDSTVTSALLVQEFSSDFAATKTAIKGMQFQKGFTNMAQGLMMAKDLLEKTARPNVDQTVLMITDGVPSFEYTTGQAAQKLRKSGNLVVVHVKSHPKPQDVALMKEYAKFEGNYMRIPGKQKLKEDMATYASDAVVKMCPKAESPSLIEEEDNNRGFKKLFQGWWCSNPMPVKWFGGHEGAGWADEMSKETCGAKSKELGYTFFEYTFYPGSTFHECLVYVDQCDRWSRWTHANIYSEYERPEEEISNAELPPSIGPGQGYMR